MMGDGTIDDGKNMFDFDKSMFDTIDAKKQKNFNVLKHHFIIFLFTATNKVKISPSWP